MHVGKGGVSEQALDAVREALAAHELVKVKVLDIAPQPARPTGEAIVAAIPGARLVQVIGRTVVLYMPDPDEPGIRLPG